MNQFPARGTQLVIVLMVSTLFSCSLSKDCSTLDMPGERDWCWYEGAVHAAEADDLVKVNEAVGQIQEPMVKAAAVNKVLSIAPTGIDEKSAMVMCDLLNDNDRQACVNTWKRPHLWDK